MMFLLGIGRTGRLSGMCFYGVRSALLVGTALLMAPLFLDVAPAPERAASRPEPPPSATDKLTGRVTRVRDGDTVEVSDIAGADKPISIAPSTVPMPVGAQPGKMFQLAR